jgi:hypothetical protein
MITSAVPKGVDQVGLPQFHPSYAKKGCRECHGRGTATYLIDDGYKDGKPNPDRLLALCPCSNRGYTRTRLKFEARVAVVWKEYQELNKLDASLESFNVPRTEEDAQKAVLKEFGFGS